MPNYARVKYQNVYPGVDLVYYGTQSGQLEYDFVVAPGANPHAIGLSFQGAAHMHLDKATGDLVLAVDGNELRFRKPVVYQEVHPRSEVRGPKSRTRTRIRAIDNRQSVIGNSSTDVSSSRERTRLASKWRRTITALPWSSIQYWSIPPI